MTFLYLVYTFYYKYSKDHAYKQTLKKPSNELSYTIYKNIYVTVHYIVYGAGATRSSVPLLQYCRIS